jgi:aspartyl-tRNA(Asn)/glutamyl-tRNA(Gln) amidotransferase subunit A
VSELIRKDASVLAGLVSSGEVSAVEVAQAHLDRIAAVDGDVHAFLHVDTDGALASAAAVDAKVKAGDKLSVLAGVPLGLKDILATNGLPTTCGSRVLDGWIPPYDATVVTKLREAGVVILGKTNMDEFAMGSSTEHSAFGPTHNPWDLERIPGGSGGGSSGVFAAGTLPGGAGTAGQGNNGGGQTGWATPFRTGGGGGAGGAGVSAGSGTGTVRGDGGPGLASSIIGTSFFYAGGGGGGIFAENTPGVGGVGGGGDGTHTGAATSGTDGLGGGDRAKRHWPGHG